MCVWYLLSLDEVFVYVVGYVVLYDVLECVFQVEQFGGQWLKGKNVEMFNLFGLVLVFVDEVDLQNFCLWLMVNGEVWQDLNIVDMIFIVVQIVYYLLQYFVFEFGDFINIGMLQGVVLLGCFLYLCVGDVVEIVIDGLGCQCQMLLDVVV